VMPKRGNGEGSIYWQESKQRWAGAVTLDGGKRKVLYGKTRQEVGRKLSAALQAKEKGLPPPRDTVTVGAFLQDWVTVSAMPRVRSSTWDSYESIVRFHLVPALGKRALTKLTPRDVQAAAQRQSRGWTLTEDS
jgi:integrase